MWTFLYSRSSQSPSRLSCGLMWMHSTHSTSWVIRTRTRPLAKSRISRTAFRVRTGRLARFSSRCACSSKQSHQQTRSPGRLAGASCFCKQFDDADLFVLCGEGIGFVVQFFSCRGMRVENDAIHEGRRLALLQGEVHGLLFGIEDAEP